MTDKITKEDKILMDSITDLLNDYIASKKSPLLILNDIAKVFTVLYKYNNIGSCKKVIKTLTTERNSFCRFFESQGLLIKWNVKTDDMQIWKNESYTGDLNESFSDWIKNEREESKEAKKKAFENDLNLFKEEYSKRIKKLFSTFTDSQKEVFKGILKNL